MTDTYGPIISNLIPEHKHAIRLRAYGNELVQIFHFTSEDDRDLALKLATVLIMEIAYLLPTDIPKDILDKMPKREDLE